MEEEDLGLEQDLFVTKLALDILDGRSFDITGKKCAYQKLFDPVNKESGKGESEVESQQATSSGDQDQEKEEGDYVFEGEVNVPFVQDMLRKIDMEYDKLFIRELDSVREFRESEARKTSALSVAHQIAIYQKTAKTRIDYHCKAILANIQNLQNKFQNVNRLKEVTDNLESLSKAINFEPDT